MFHIQHMAQRWESVESGILFHRPKCSIVCMCEYVCAFLLHFSLSVFIRVGSGCPRARIRSSIPRLGWNPSEGRDHSGDFLHGPFSRYKCIPGLNYTQKKHFNIWKHFLHCSFGMVHAAFLFSELLHGQMLLWLSQEEHWIGLYTALKVLKVNLTGNVCIMHTFHQWINSWIDSWSHWEWSGNEWVSTRVCCYREAYLKARVFQNAARLASASWWFLKQILKSEKAMWCVKLWFQFE